MTQTGDVAITRTLDCSGLLCPLPVYKAALAMKELEPGQVLELICTDPGSHDDIPAMARERGDTLLGVNAASQAIVFLIEKGPIS